MRKNNFIITYDISSDKRLRKIAKTLEHYTFRIQKSIFYYPDATKTDIKSLIEKLLSIADKELDDIRIYQIDLKNSFALFSGLDIKNITVKKDECI